jgi:basic membrane protein A
MKFKEDFERMKKTRIISFVIVLAMMVSLMAACNGGGATKDAGVTSQESQTQESTSQAAPAGDVYELALVTDLGTIDDKSFNQGSWEGLLKYANENNIKHKYYQPPEQSDDAYLSTIDLAVKGGAKVIVTPGFLFQVPVYIAQERYPDVNFILVDGTPQNENYEVRIDKNAVGIHYAEEEAGFLAGYAAIKDGMRNLGFMGGMAVPAVVRFGYGYIQGAEYAAQELGLGVGSVKMNYFYTGGFAATPEAQVMAASWYKSGIEVIFACGGAVGNSVMAAAEQSQEKNKKVIGVDVDQSAESKTVITSATKGLGVSVYDSIAAYYKGSFPGGQEIIFRAENDGVGLPMATSRFDTFSQADYDVIYGKLASNSMTLIRDTDGGNPVTINMIPVQAVTVTSLNTN